MREILANFQSQCVLSGVERTRLLQKLVSSAVAYASPVPTGEPNRGMDHYRMLGLPLALQVISEINERVLIDTEQALSDARHLYICRYDTLNTPIVDTSECPFIKGLTETGFDYTQHFNAWVPKFLAAVIRFKANLEV